jgi:lactoylglutathione lyase
VIADGCDSAETRALANAADNATSRTIGIDPRRAPRMTASTSNHPNEFNAFKPRVSHLAYHVTDIDRALGFYIGVLGFKEQLRFPLGKGLHEAVLGFPDSHGGGLILMWHTERTTPYQLGDAYSRLVITVSDVDAALDHVKKHGVPIVQPAKDTGPFKYALIKDPDGYLIELLYVKRA